MCLVASRGWRRDGPQFLIGDRNPPCFFLGYAGQDLTRGSNSVSFITLDGRKLEGPRPQTSGPRGRRQADAVDNLLLGSGWQYKSLDSSRRRPRQRIDWLFVLSISPYLAPFRRVLVTFWCSL